MLAGTAMGSAPVIIHLLNRQRYRRITWAAMHWLLASFKKSSRRLQIEDLILLIIRILILVLLALALARPFLADSGSMLGGRAEVHRVVVLDTSYSMGYGSGEKTAFSRAKEMARELAGPGTLSSGDAVTLISMTDQARVRIPASSNLDEVYREVDAAELSHGGSDAVRALTRAFESLDAHANPRKEIFLITDMTENGWLDPRAETEELRGIKALRRAVEAYEKKHPDRKLPGMFLVDVGEENTQNLATVGLEADVNVIAAKSQVIFKAQVANYSGKDRQRLPVTFRVDGQRISSQYVDVKYGGNPQEVMFYHQFEAARPHYVSVEIEGDRLALDDVRHMAVPVVSSLRVLLVDGEEKADPFESECGLLNRALSIPITPRMASMGMTSPSIIETRAITDADLEEALFQGDMVVLANVPVIPRKKIPALRKFVREGGALLIFVGDNVDPQLYNEKLFTEKEPLLPCRLVRPEGLAGNPDATKWFSFEVTDKVGSIIPCFAKPESRIYMAGPKRQTPDIGVKIFRRYLVKVDETDQKGEKGEEKATSREEQEGGAGAEAGSAEKRPEKPKQPEKETDAGEEEEEKADGEAGKGKAPQRGRVSIPLRYEDGEPAILLRDFGMGQVCLVTTTADSDWTTWPSSRIAFLPAMHELVYHLVRNQLKEHNLPVGGTFSVRWPVEHLLKEVTVVPPKGREEDKAVVKPESSKDDVTTLTYHGRSPEEGVRWAGPYHLHLAGEEDLPRSIFVANVPADEANLARISPELIRKYMKKPAFVVINDRKKIAEAIRSKASGREFWRNLCWAVLTLALAEAFLAWFFGRNRW
jgi:hypothetical protein